MAKHRKEPGCTCLLCRPVPGRRAHPKYGYDLDKVANMECMHCNNLIGQEAFVEQMSLARFGSMSFVHKRCETLKEARARIRMDKNWDRRMRRK